MNGPEILSKFLKQVFSKNFFPRLVLIVNNPFIIFIYVNSENRFLSKNESNKNGNSINKDDNQIHIAR